MKCLISVVRKEPLNVYESTMSRQRFFYNGINCTGTSAYLSLGSVLYCFLELTCILMHMPMDHMTLKDVKRITHQE